MPKEQKMLLKKIYGQLGKVIEQYEKLSDAMKDKPSKELANQLYKSFDTILQIADVFEQTGDVHWLELSTDYIHEQKDGIKSAIESEEYDIITEILEFEIIPMLEEWYDELIEIFGE